jgi:hypothetical protein
MSARCCPRPGRGCGLVRPVSSAVARLAVSSGSPSRAGQGQYSHSTCPQSPTARAHRAPGQAMSRRPSRPPDGRTSSPAPARLSATRRSSSPGTMRAARQVALTSGCPSGRDSRQGLPGGPRPPPARMARPAATATGSMSRSGSPAKPSASAPPTPPSASSTGRGASAASTPDPSPATSGTSMTSSTRPLLLDGAHVPHRDLRTPGPARPPRPGKQAGQRADAGKCTLSSAANVKPRMGRLRGPCP